jgi:hypothetical protein
MRLTLAALTVFCGGCIIGAGYSTRDRVTQAAREYNDDVRWGRYEQAKKHVPNDYRKQFVDRHKALDDDLEIADYEMVALEIDKSDKKKTKVTAQVEYTWSLKRRGLVEKTSTKQLWEEHDGEWVMAREERVKGAPLTLFDEPQPE